jgi:TatD DNase family protein
MELIDTHCHLDVAEFDPDRSRVISAARAAGVAEMVVPAIQAAGWPGLLDLCAGEKGLYPALGMHPVFLEEHRDHHLEELERLLAIIRPVAVGEIGLDYFLRELDRERQGGLFEDQLSIAAAAGLPVLIHARKSHDQVLAALRRNRVVGGIVHAFNGSVQQAFKYLDLGFRLGIGGMITFERSNRLRALARAVPEEAIVLETDAPDMTVASHRGQRNSPEYLPEVLRALAQVRGTDVGQLAMRTTRTAREVLALG